MGLPSKVHCSHATIVTHEDGNADEPDDAKLSSRPDTTEIITSKERPANMSALGLQHLSQAHVVQ